MEEKNTSGFPVVPKFPFYRRHEVLLTYELTAVVSIGLSLLKSNIPSQKLRPMSNERTANRKKKKSLKNTFFSREKDLLMSFQFTYVCKHRKIITLLLIIPVSNETKNLLPQPKLRREAEGSCYLQ